MDDTVEVPQTRGSEGSDARGSRDPVAHPVETSIAQRTAPELVLWSWWITRAGGKKSQRKERPNWSKCGSESHARAGAADDPHHRQQHEEPEFPIIMADYCFMQDAPGSELFTILDMLDAALGMMGPTTYVISAVVEYLRAWGRKKVIFRIDGEPATRALGVAIQHARSEETVIECRPKYPRHQWVRLRT